MSTLRFESKQVVDKDLMEAPNLCDRFTSEELSVLGNWVYTGYQQDCQSRSGWEKRMNAALDLAMLIAGEKSFPWPDCANVVFPLITVAALQFSARSYTNLISGPDIVKYRVGVEDPDGKIQQKADRLGRHMSWQALEKDVEWEEQHDKLLTNLGIVGTTFIKTYYCPLRGCPISEMVQARDLVVDYFAKSVEKCERKTHTMKLSRNEIHERVKRGLFRDILAEDWYNVAPPPAQGVPSDHRQGVSPPAYMSNAPLVVLEQHCYLDLDQDGYAEPYVVTVAEASRKVLRVVARFEREEDIERNGKGEIISITPTEYFTKYSFIPSPDGGIYDIGFGILLGPLNETVNSGINQILDAGTIQNSMGGFLGRGAKIRGGVYTMAPWEWKRVDSTGDDLRKSLVPFPERQPSAVMFNMMGMLIEYTGRVSGTTDPMVGVNPGQNTPAETSRSMIEQGSQVFNVIFKRVWRSMKEEFRKRHVLNAIYMPLRQRFGSGNEVAVKDDYMSSIYQVVPVADPNMTSTAMRFMQASTLRQSAMMVPGYDVEAVERNFLRALRVDNIDTLYPGPDKVPPLPNPKAQLEQMKLEAKKLEFAHQKQMLVMELMEDRRLNNAKISQLTAQAASLIAGIGADRAQLQLSALDSAIAALQAQNDMMTSRLEALNRGEEGDTGRGVPQLADTTSNTGVSESTSNMEGELEGAMGSGSISA